MTRNRFYRYLILVSLLPIVIFTISGIDYFASSDQKVFKFFKEMSAYILLFMAPLIANIFTLRQKFAEKLEIEWRRIVETKSKILAFLDKKEISMDDYINIYYKLSQDIDYLRLIYKNVGEDEKHIGLYPYETLHDFRRAIEKCNPELSYDIVSQEIRDSTRNIINETFKAFRDVYLIELNPPEPDYPIIRHNMRRLRKDGMTAKSQNKAYRADDRLMKRFGLDGKRNGAVKE